MVGGSSVKTIVAVVVALLAAVSRFAGIPAAAPPPDPFVYVALGDSYTSGPLVLPHDQTFVPQDCGQSTRNYPHLVAALLNADVFRDVSCGSATIDDFYTPQTGLPAGGTNAAQFDALIANVDAVTVGIGGNDIGFVGFATNCIQPTPAELGGQPCTPANAGPNDAMSQKIAALIPKLGAALDEIHRRAPHAAVLVVSYPDALPDDGVGCYPYLPILNSDMPYLVSKFKEMNSALQSAASAHNASYVDIYSSSIDHDACKPPGLAWVNGAVLVPPSFPAHPNDFSFLNSAPIVADAIHAATGS
jgi:lysophospholipase L1-like esterase